MMDAALFQKIYLFQDLGEDELQQVLNRTEPPGIFCRGGHHSGRRARG